MGIINKGVVYAVFNYGAQNNDELTFADGDCLQVLRKGDEHEKDWWWARFSDSEGYIPRNLLGVSLFYFLISEICCLLLSVSKANRGFKGSLPLLPFFFTRNKKNFGEGANGSEEL